MDQIETLSFVVEFADGSTYGTEIRGVDLLAGEHLAAMIVRQRQLRGEIPDKPVRAITRAGQSPSEPAH
jgi:hypothetical protein